MESVDSICRDSADKQHMLRNIKLSQNLKTANFLKSQKQQTFQGHSHRYGWPSFNRTISEATTTFLPILTNSVARPADRLAATRPQLTELEIDSLKAMLPTCSIESAKVS